MSCFQKWDIGGCGCPACTVTILVNCNGTPVTGAAVTLKNGGGTTVATGTTSAGSVTLTIPGGGPYTITATATGDAGATVSAVMICGGSYTVDICCPVTVCALDAGGSPIAGATVTIASGGTTVATGTTAAGGCVTLDVLAAGTYTVTISATGYTSFSADLAVGCNTTITETLCTPANSVTFYVLGCGVAQPGATVTFGTQTKTTDSSGHAVFGMPTSGTYSWSVSQTRYTTATGSQTVSGCTAASVPVPVSLTPATGYHCGCNDATHYLPYPTTLHFTDSQLGSGTATYVGPYWLGSINVPSLTGCQCGNINSPATNDTTVFYTWPSAGYGTCGGDVEICTPQLVTVPVGATGGNYCLQPCTFGSGGPILTPTSYSYSGAPLNVSATYTGCYPCNTVLGYPQGQCGGADMPVWLAATVTVTWTE